MPSKRCTKCGETKPLDAFHRNARNRDGKHTQCKSCRIEAVQRWERANPERVRQRKRERMKRLFAERDPRLLARQRAHQRERMKRLYALRDPRIMARKAVREAVRRGRLVRGPCAVCGATPTDGHHHAGYEPEHALDVVFLCQEHHRAVHPTARPRVVPRPAGAQSTAGAR